MSLPAIRMGSFSANCVNICVHPKMIGKRMRRIDSIVPGNRTGQNKESSTKRWVWRFMNYFDKVGKIS